MLIPFYVVNILSGVVKDFLFVLKLSEFLLFSRFEIEV